MQNYLLSSSALDRVRLSEILRVYSLLIIDYRLYYFLYHAYFYVAVVICCIILFRLLDHYFSMNTITIYILCGSAKLIYLWDYIKNEAMLCHQSETIQTHIIPNSPPK